MSNEKFINVRAIKLNKDIDGTYIRALHTWLNCENTAKEFFVDKWRAKAWNDFDYFNSTTDRDHLIMPNEVMMIDREVDGEHWMMICRVGENPNKTKVTHLHKVIRISKIRKTWRAGYWLLPKFNYYD